MKIFLDANVLFAASYNPSGTPAKMIGVAKRYKMQLMTSFYAMHETKKNLMRKSPKALQQFKKLMNGVQLVDTPDLQNDFLLLRKKDLPIYRSALHANCSYLITGDHRDFSGLKKRNLINLMQILSPSEFLEGVLEEGSINQSVTFSIESSGEGHSDQNEKIDLSV